MAVKDKFQEYIAKAPYPEMRVVSPNRYYSELLMDDFSGINGKMTLYNQFMYHYYESFHNQEEVSDVFRVIADVQRYHMDILAELILQLGGYPVYRLSFCSGKDCWNSGNVQYGRKCLERLNLDLDGEYSMIRDLNTHIKLISDPYVQDILKRIILDDRVITERLMECVHMEEAKQR